MKLYEFHQSVIFEKMTKFEIQLENGSKQKMDESNLRISQCEFHLLLKTS